MAEIISAGQWEEKKNAFLTNQKLREAENKAIKALFSLNPDNKPDLSALTLKLGWEQHTLIGARFDAGVYGAEGVVVSWYDEKLDSHYFGLGSSAYPDAGWCAGTFSIDYYESMRDYIYDHTIVYKTVTEAMLAAEVLAKKVLTDAQAHISERMAELGIINE